MDQNRGDFLIIMGRTNRNHGDFSPIRVGAYGIRPTNGHIGGKINQNRGDFSSVRVGAYGICPTNEHIGGQMDQNRGDFLIIMGRMNRNCGDFSSVRVGAYCIRLTNEHIGGRMNRKMTGSVVHLFTYNGERANQYVRPLFSDGTMGAYAIRPYPDRRKGGVFFVRRRSGKGWLGGGGLLLSIDIV